MKKVLKELSDFVDQYEIIDSSVSSWTVGDQIEHCTAVINGVCTLLGRSNPSEYDPKFNFSRLFVMTFKFIPRGMGKAPKQVNPEVKDQRTKEELLQLIDKVQVKFDTIINLPLNSFFVHHYFGQMNLEQSIKFLEIHTKHHLKIIKDIVKSRA